MARPLKEKLDYFPHIAKQDDEKMEIFLKDRLNYFVYYKLRELICIKGGYYVFIAENGINETVSLDYGNEERKKEVTKEIIEYRKLCQEEFEKKHSSASIDRIVLLSKLEIAEKDFSKFLEEAFKYNALDRQIYEAFNILTSKAIQEDFIKATEKRKSIKLIANIILFDIEFIETNYGTIQKPSLKLKGIADDYRSAEIQIKDISGKANKIIERFSFEFLYHNRELEKYIFCNGKSRISEYEQNNVRKGYTIRYSFDDDLCYNNPPLHIYSLLEYVIAARNDNELGIYEVGY